MSLTIPQVPTMPNYQGVLIQPNTAVPVYVDPSNGNVVLSPAQFTKGLAVVAEVNSAATALTVADGDTFEGILVLMAAGAGGGTVTVSAGDTVLAEKTYTADTPITPLIVPVSVTGGSDGTAIAAAVADSGVCVSALLAGYVAS